MAKATHIEKVKTAKKAYELALKGLAGELAKEIGATLAPLIHDGWFLTWSQADDCYNDEDYFFDLQGVCLATVREPEQGEQISPARPRKTEQRTRPPRWHGDRETTYEHVLDHGDDAIYAYTLNPKGKKRTDVDAFGGDPGVLPVTDDGIKRKNSWPAEACGLDREIYHTLCDAFEAIGKDTMRQAFGDNATVRIDADGKITTK